ncbi:hypothetical protein IJ579_05980 [bacterium]|nr:hypothetical protein [bacterium]
MSSESNKSYILPAALGGGFGGAVYGFFNPSDDAIKKIMDKKPTLTDALEEYAKSFDLEEAKKALESKNLTQDEFNSLEEIFSNHQDWIAKEKVVNEILDTPFNEREKSFKDAVKEANKARSKLYKSISKFKKIPQETMEKLIELKIVNMEVMEKAYKAMIDKAFFMFKELSKGAMKGIGFGIALGTAFGGFLNYIARKN